MAGSGTEGGEIQVGVLVKEITQKLYGGGARGKTGVCHRRRTGTDLSASERNNTIIIWGGGQEGRQGFGT